MFGLKLGFHGDFMVIWGDLMVIYRDFVGFHGNVYLVSLLAHGT